MTDRPGVVLMQELAKDWPRNTAFWPTERMVFHLRSTYPEMWGAASSFGKPLSAQRLGRMLSRGYRIRSTRLRHDGELVRGYTLVSMLPAWRRLRIDAPDVPVQPLVPVTERR